MDILTGENYSSIYVNLDLIYWPVRSYCWRGGKRIKGMKGGGGIGIIASCERHFIRGHENLVQHPSNHIQVLR